MAKPVIEGLCQKPRGFHRPPKIQSPFWSPIHFGGDDEGHLLHDTHSFSDIFFTGFLGKFVTFFCFVVFFCDGEVAHQVAHPRRSRKNHPASQKGKACKHHPPPWLWVPNVPCFVCCCWNSGWDGLFSSVWAFCLVSLRRKYNMYIYIHYNIYIYNILILYTVCFIPFVLDTRPNGVQSWRLSFFAGVPNLVWQPYLGVMYTRIPGETVQFEEYFSSGLNPPPNHIYI